MKKGKKIHFLPNILVAYCVLVINIRGKYGHYFKSGALKYGRK
jgi:hypothetical protein